MMGMNCNQIGIFLCTSTVHSFALTASSTGFKNIVRGFPCERALQHVPMTGRPAPFLAAVCSTVLYKKTYVCIKHINPFLGTIVWQDIFFPFTSTRILIASKPVPCC